MDKQDRIVLAEGKSFCLNQVVGVVFGILSLAIPPLILLRNNDWSESLKIGFLLLPFLWVATILLFKRSGCWIDLSDRTYVSWSEYLWFPRKEAVIPLAEFSSVTVAKRVETINGSRRIHRTVNLESAEPIAGVPSAVVFGQPQSYFELYRYSDQEKAAAKGRALAEKLGMSLRVIDEFLT
jgi:hypothetical protein